jgi:Tol biopolymer transport system component
MRRMFILLALGLATGCNDKGTTKPPPPVTVQQKIVFSSTRDVAQSEVYVMNTDGSNVVRLTNNAVNDEAAVFSPNGTKIAFRRELSTVSIFLMHSDGSAATSLAPGLHAEWSPDGTKLALVADSLYLINPDGTGKHGLGVGAEYVTWKPDGTRLAYISHGLAGQQEYEIYTINPDGSNPVLISDALEKDGIAWSPDGTKIAYGDASGIHIMNTDGTGSALLTAGSNPRWSPDGSRIVYDTAALDGNSEVYTIKLDGTGATNLTNNGAGDFAPDWGPRQ